MPTHITQIGKHKFISGLFWQSLSRPRDLWKEAGELAGKIDSDLIVLRKDHAMAQAGYAQTKDGARRGLHSLAAVISKSLALEGAYYDGRQQPVHNWLSAFKLPDGMWMYCAVRDANFLPNGDFAGSKEEVLERLHGDYGLGGWNVVIGDPELEECGFHNFSAKQIDSLIPRTRSGQIKVYAWSALRPVGQRIAWRPLAAVGAIGAVLSIGGALGWQHYQHKKQEEARARAIDAVRRNMLGNAAASLVPHPWPAMPPPRVSTRACLERLHLIAPAGWQLNQYECKAGRANYSWSRGGSNVGYLLEQVPRAAVDLSGDSASYSESLSLKPGSDEALLEADQLLRPLLAKFQLLGLKPRIALRPPPPPPPPSPLTGNKETPQPDWRTFSIAADLAGVPPADAAEILSQPGIRLDRLTYRAGAWSIEGVIYAK